MPGESDTVTGAERSNTLRLDDYVARTRAAAFIVLHENRIVMERYARGHDQHSLLNPVSIAKAVMSTQVGMPLDDDRINGLDGTVGMPVSDYLAVKLWEPLSAHVIFNVEIRDMARYQDFMKGVKPALDAAGGRYLARGGAHKVYEGDWQPRRIVVLEFPSVAAFESFYTGPVYQGLRAVRDECSSARLVSVEGLE